jgi:hypothetical protein
MPAFSLTNCIGGALFGAFGFVAFAYGKRMGHWTPMFCGLALMMLPLFVADVPLLITSATVGGIAIIFRHN